MPRRLCYSVTDDLDNGYARAMISVAEQAESFSVGLSTSYGYSAEGYCDFADYVAVLGEVYGRLSDVNGVDKGSSIFSRYKSFSDILRRAAERENVLFLKAKAALSISGALARARDDSNPNDWSRFYGDGDDSLDLDDWVDEFDGEEEPEEVEEGSGDAEGGMGTDGLSPDALNMLDLLRGAGSRTKRRNPRETGTKRSPKTGAGSRKKRNPKRKTGAKRRKKIPKTGTKNRKRSRKKRSPKRKTGTKNRKRKKIGTKRSLRKTPAGATRKNRKRKSLRNLRKRAGRTKKRSLKRKIGQTKRKRSPKKIGRTKRKSLRNLRKRAGQTKRKSPKKTGQTKRSPKKTGQTKKTRKRSPKKTGRTRKSQRTNPRMTPKRRSPPLLHQSVFLTLHHDPRVLQAEPRLVHYPCLKCLPTLIRIIPHMLLRSGLSLRLLWKSRIFAVCRGVSSRKRCWILWMVFCVKLNRGLRVGNSGCFFIWCRNPLLGG